MTEYKLVGIEEGLKRKSPDAAGCMEAITGSLNRVENERCDTSRVIDKEDTPNIGQVGIHMEVEAIRPSSVITNC